PDTLVQLQSLATLLVARHRIAEAIPLFQQALAGDRAAIGEAHVRTLTVANALGAACEQLGRSAEAERSFLATTAALGERRGKALDRVRAEAAFHLACLAAARGEAPRALEWLKASLDAGFSDAGRMSGSPSLKSLRGAEFDALLARMPPH